MIKIGDKFNTNKCGIVEVIDYKDHKNITVKFLDTGHIDTYSSQTIKKGVAYDNSLYEINKLVIGNVYESKSSGHYKIISIDEWINVKFLSTGNIKKYDKKSIKSILFGNIKDNINYVGKIFKTNNCGNAEITSYISSSEVYVKFINTGTIVKCTLQNLKNGQVRDNTSDIKPNQIFETTCCGFIKILNYYNYNDVIVEFINTGTIKRTDVKSIRNGNIFDVNSGLPSHGYRSEQVGYLYIHKINDMWYKIGITNNYEQRFNTQHCNILKPISYKCFSGSGEEIRNIETRILNSIKLVYENDIMEVEKYFNLGKTEVFYFSDLDTVLSIIQEYNLTEHIVKEGKII